MIANVLDRLPQGENINDNYFLKKSTAESNYLSSMMLTTVKRWFWRRYFAVVALLAIILLLLTNSEWIANAKAQTIIKKQAGYFDDLPYPLDEDAINGRNAKFKFNQYRQMAKEITRDRLEQIKRINSIEPQYARKVWQIFGEPNVPLTSKEAIDTFSDYLPWWELEELSAYSQVWYLALGQQKNNFTNNPKTNFGLSYIYRKSKPKRLRLDAQVGDHVAYRYKVTKIMGKGTYGLAVRAYDFKTERTVAIKFMRQETDNWDTHRGIREANMFALINRLKKSNDHFPALYDTFVFRNHLCIVMELMGANLYEITNDETQQTISSIPRYAYDILQALAELHDLNLVHADIKRENAMFSREYNKDGRHVLKMVDFGITCIPGTSGHFRCLENSCTPNLRCPEVMLDLPFDQSCDMFVVGIYLIQAATGVRYFTPPRHKDRLQNLMEVIGQPPTYMQHNLAEYRAEVSPDKQLAEPTRPPLREILQLIPDTELVDLISKLLIFDPLKRLTASEALQHPFIAKAGFDEL